VVVGHLACSGPCPLVVEGHDRRAARRPLFAWHQSLHLRRCHRHHGEKVRRQRQRRRCPSCRLRYYGSSGHPYPHRRRRGPNPWLWSGQDGLVESAPRRRHAWRTCGGRDGRRAFANWRNWQRPRDGNGIESIIEYILGTRTIGIHIIGYSSTSKMKLNKKRRDLTDGAATGAGEEDEESGSLMPLAASESAGQWLASMTAGPLGEGCFQAERLTGEAEGEGDGAGNWSCGVGSGEESAAGGSIVGWLARVWGDGCFRSAVAAAAAAIRFGGKGWGCRMRLALVRLRVPVQSSPSPLLYSIPTFLLLFLLLRA
jgi:hypothetical protein